MNINSKKNNQNNKKKIQIIAGKLKGKKITTIQHPDLRPTTNQIRETLFNWLTPIIHRAHCLDCFAGSGALGLEAISRNANIVTFLEKNKKISNQLKKTIELLKIQNQTKIITTDTNKWLIYFKKNTKPYNIIFLDPPFSKWHYMKNTIKLLEKSQIINKNTWIYIENKNNKNNSIPSIIPNTWKLHKKKTQETSLTKFILNTEHI